MIQEDRIKALNERQIRAGRYVLYWMQASQRAQYNHALELAVRKANELGLPPLVFFGITDDFPEANERHYYFMLEGLKEAKAALRSRGIGMLVLHRSPGLAVVELSREAAMVIVDRGYLRLQRIWRDYAARRVACPLIQVESDVVVPVETASPKEEYAAATIRSKINTRIGQYLKPLRSGRVKKTSLELDRGSFDIEDTDAAVARLKIDKSVSRVKGLVGGTTEAGKRLRRFIRTDLERFDELRNDPTQESLSGMSPYLHFGQISPLYIALKIKEARRAGVAAYLEELLIRRELR